MSRSSSPFFREHVPKTELSPLLSDEQSRQPRFDVSLGNGKARKPKPSRTSMPLVYTDFRSPDASRANLADGNMPSRTNDGHGVATDESRTPSDSLNHDAITRHSFVTNLENIGSKSVWMILFLPILLGIAVYFATVSWRYTGWTSEFTEGLVLVSSPPAAVQAGFMRSFVSIPGYYCEQPQCADDKLNVRAHLQSSEASERPKKAINLLHTYVNVADFAAQYYAPYVNNSISTNKTLVMPLPILRLNSPVFGLHPSEQEINLLSTLSMHTRTIGGDTENSTQKEDSSIDSTTSISESTLLATHSTPTTSISYSTSLPMSDTLTPTLTTITTSRTYMLTVATLQIVLSFLTFAYLLYIVSQVYANAKLLRDKFAEVHNPTSTSYGSINSYDYKGYDYSGIAEEDALILSTEEAPTIWHFILPEQYSAIALLVFLCTWQGFIPSLCAILEDFGIHASEGMLFSGGLLTSFAQFGLVFTLILYVDGLKYNSKDGQYKPNRTNNTYSIRSYDPFSMHSDNNSVNSAYDANSSEFWRRSSTGLANSHRTQNQKSDLTPLQREYRNAIQLYVTYHHPRSTDFVGFVHKKLIMLLLTWVIVVVYWLLYYPRLWHSKAFTQVQNDNILLRFAIVEYLLMAVSVVWVYWIVQVSISTGLRLRRLKLNASRFRQVAFRTLFFQLQLGLVVLLCTIGWYTSTHPFFTSTTFASTFAYWHYIYLWATHYGLLHPLILSTPPVAVHSAESLVFVTALVYSIAYCMQPPLEDPNTSKFKIQEFVGLERNLPEQVNATSSLKNAKNALKKNKLQSKLRQYLVEEDYKRFMNAYLPSVLNQHAKQYFCVESALIYLEISYQTYFPVDVVLSGVVDGNKVKNDALNVTTKDKTSLTANATTTATLAPKTMADTKPSAQSAFLALPSPGTFGRQISDKSIMSLSSNSMISDAYSTTNNSPLHRASTTTATTPTANAASMKLNPFEETEPEEEGGNAQKQTVNPFEGEECREQGTVHDETVAENKVSSKVQLSPLLIHKEEAQSVQEPHSCSSVATSSNPFEADAISEDGEEEYLGAKNDAVKTTLTNPFDDDWSAPPASQVPQAPERAKLSNTNNAVKFSVPATMSPAKKTSANPFADATETANEPDPSFIEAPAPVLPSGPKLNLSGVGYTLKSTFSCDKYTTFGFLAECEADKKLVVSFRGSVLGNAVSNLKIAQVTLPSLKRPRAYFTHLIRDFTARNHNNRSADNVFSQLHHNSYQNKDYSPHIAKLRANSSDSDDSHVELIKDAKDLSFTYEHMPSTDEHNDYMHLLNRMENGDVYDEEYENENNFTPPESATSTTDKINNSQLAKDIKSVGKSIPILNQGFKRVHAGFWNSYSSIREDFLQSVVVAMYQHRQQTIRQLQQQSGVSPTHSWYVPRNGNNVNSPVTTPFGSNSSGVNPSSPRKENDTISGIKALFTSPLGKNNPFSPLFSPINNNNNNHEQAGSNDASLYPTSYSTKDNHNSNKKKDNNHAADPAADMTPLSITFCGHSLGAAIASLAAFELAENLPLIMEAFALEDCFNTPKTLAVQQLNSVLSCPAPALSLYMYGSPRVGNSLFSSAMSKKIDNIYRMQVNGDLVCMMPKFIGFYRHIGTAVLLDEGESGNIIIQPSIIESSILQHYTGNVHNHSLDKYRACLEACLEPTELTEYLTNEFQNLSMNNNTTFVGESTKSNSTVGGNNVVVNKRKSIYVDDIPEWLVASSNV